MDTHIASLPDMLPGPAKAEPMLQLGQLARLLRRHLWLIGLCAVAAAAGAYMYAHGLPRSYTADGLITVAGDRFAIPELRGVLRDDTSPDPMPTVHTEVQALASRALISQVAAQLKLAEIPEFNPALRPPTPIQRLKDAVGALIARLLPQQPTTQAPADASDEAVVGAATRALSIFQDNRSLVISISFTAHDPRLAARFVNALTDAYVASRARHRINANSGANAALAQRVEQARADLDAIEQQMRDLRSKSDVVGLRAGSVGQQQVEELTTAAARATLERSQLEVSYERATAAAKQGSSDALAAVLNSPTVSQLRNQEAQASRRMAELSSHYGSGYPGMRAAAAELASARAQIGSETARIVASLGAQLRVAREQEADVKRQLEAARHDAVAGENARAQLDQLQQEATTRRGLYQTLLERQQQTVAQPAASETPDVRVLSPAVPPAFPSGPNMKIAALMGGSGGALFGCLLALTRVRSVRGVETAEALTQATGLNVLATLPRNLVRRGHGLLAARAPEGGGGEDVEAMRSLRGQLRFTGRGGVPRCVLFVPDTPAAPLAAPLAAAFARAVAIGGERVLLIECDLQAPALAVALGFKPMRGDATEAGILAVLDGADWRDSVTLDRQPGLDLLLAGGHPAGTQALLNGPRFQNLLIETRAEYDLVVLHAGAGAAADAASLVQRADTAILVADGRLDRAATQEAAARLSAGSRTPLVAVLLRRT